MEEIDKLAYEYALKEFPNGNTGEAFANCMKDFKNGYLLRKDETIHLVKKSIGDFLSEGCPNFPKDKIGSWLKWVDNWITKNL